MKKYSYILTAAMLLCASCSEESMFDSTLAGENVINATFEQGTSGSRAALVQGDNDALSLKWTAGDAIAVFGEGDNGTKTKAVYTLDAGSVGQSNGSFVGQTVVTGTVKGAVYPYYETDNESNVTWEQWQDLAITLPSEITFDANEPNKCNVPMWGNVSDNGSVSFKHLGSLLKIDFTDMPTDYDQLIVSSSSPISGTFNVKVDSDEPILLMGTKSAENQKVTINFTALTDSDTENDKVFYLPLPSGTYASLSVAIGKSTDADANLVLRNWTNIAFERAKYYTAAVAYVAVTGSDVNAINSALTSTISGDNTTAQLVMENAITVGGEISVPENSTNVSLDFTSVSGTTSSIPLTINSDVSATQGEATKTLSLNIPTDDVNGSYVTVNTPTSTVNLNGGKFHTLTATTAQNTLIVGNGVEITNLTVYKGNVRIKKGGFITNLTYEGGDEIYIILEDGANEPTNIIDINNKVKVVTAIEYDLANQPEGTVYNFTSDMILTQPLYIENEVTIELNGYRITHCGESFTDPNNDKALVVVKRGGKLTVNNKYGDGRISVLGFDDSHNVGPNNLNIHAAIKMTASGESSTGENASLILNNGYIEGNYYCITGNGNRHDTYIEINGGWISSLGGEIHQDLGSETLGIYHPQNGKLVINGGTIKGYESAIEMRGGELVVNNSARIEVEGATKEFNIRPNSNGNTEIGAAIAISPHKDRAVKAVINDANLKGPRALHEEYIYDGEVPTIELSMSNVNFDVNMNDNHAGIVYSENCKEFINGIVWVKNSSVLNYLANNAEANIDTDMTDLEESIKITADNVVINLNNHQITTKTSDVFEVTGSLTLNDNQEASVRAGTDTENTGSVCAVWAYDGGSVTINGGQYQVGPDKDGNRNDCIYAGSNARNTAGTIIINGGIFAFDWIAERPEGTIDIAKDGDRFLLNCADSTPASSITVNGGQFTNHVPSIEATGDGVVLGEGYNIYYKEAGNAPDDVDLNTPVTTSYISNNTTATYKYVVR